jgi:hypothetical protein
MLSVAAAILTLAGPPACHPVVDKGVLPRWARAGFSDPRPRLPHTLGRRGDIAALMFGFPLTAPPRKRVSNKILWVSRPDVRRGSDLRISAQRIYRTRRIGRPVRRRVAGGPGPSIVDLPRAGCYRMTLRWSGHVDRMDLRYRRREPGPSTSGSAVRATQPLRSPGSHSRR